jgi:asparagine synthase (glutamine-hydrolysing)
VSGVVKDQGMTVALSGLGADELFGGYGHFRSIPQMQRWLSRFGWVPSGLRRWAAATALRKARRSKREKAMDLVAGRANVLDLVLGIRRSLSDREIRQLGFAPAAVGLSEAFLPPAAYEPFRDTHGDAFRMISQAECLLYMANTLLRDSDTYSMAHSLELRVPFLGKSVSERAVSLPGSMQAPPGSPPKHLLREAAKDLLPGEVFTRPKTGFSLPMGEWMAGSLLDDCEAAIDTLAACPLIDAAGIRQLWAEYRANWTAVHWSRPLTLVVLGSYLQNRAG